ncbi:hypothetical protein ACH4CE_13770 [Streptomyces gelaticus]|uniref:hypothetical protein n=1 Tax=Streptomyces gelaticus TaxID=285446 RepID=UPI0037B28864
MLINGEDMGSGTALLIAAAPAGKGCLIDATSALPTLAAVPPGVLAGAAAATLVELADPTDPQTVLTRIRAAAAAPGPLTLYIAGQLHLDHKQRLIHLALARTTTPATLRYTALPWHWLASELKLRRPGSTTVVIDTVAAQDAWQQLRAEGLVLGYGIRLYGRIVPPPPRRQIAEPAYLKAFAAAWRSGLNPPLARLHEQAAAQAGPDDALFLSIGDPATLSVPSPVAPAAQAAQQPHQAPVPVAETTGATAEEDPLPAILAAAQAGRHGEAASLAAIWEGWALRTYGVGSVQAIHWLEVRADLARLADDPARSCELWMAAADARLARQQPPDDPAVESAVDRAHHQWQQLRDPQRARELGPPLDALRHHVPGRRPGAVDAVRHRLELLDTQPPATARGAAP